ncbi:hypothetical protein [Devosia crocina]|uniref:hypothetical protein n=1 Tax=Devosia crocina TaxID=429728 RepID=UPI000B8487E9|nr:hypothetical protein [Devosia crocina]
MGEIGAAFAVLALYVLVLLAPLHQAAGLQRDLAVLGYESQLSWSVCTSVSEPGETDRPAAIKCPLASAGKTELAVAPDGAVPIAVRQDSLAVAYGQKGSVLADHAGGRPGQPRGPPHAA